MLRFALHGLLALGLLLGGLVVLQSTDRQLDLASGQKIVEMEKLSRSDDRGIDFVAVGSSRTLFHMMPDVLDSTLAAHGHPARTYNYGLLGTPATEISYSVDKVLEANLPDLSTMLVELQPLPVHELHWHPLSRKGAYHFDAKRVRFGLEAVGASSLPPAQRRAAISRFLRLGVRHYLEAGQGTSLTRSWTKQVTGSGRRSHRRGFSPLARSRPMTMEDLEQVRVRYDRLLDSIRNRSSAPSAVDSVVAEHFMGLHADAAEQDVRILFIIQPMSTGLEGIASVLEQRGVTVIRMNDPADYPSLYEMDLWYDGSHLTYEGARMISEIAARAVAEALARAET